MPETIPPSLNRLPLKVEAIDAFQLFQDEDRRFGFFDFSNPRVSPRLSQELCTGEFEADNDLCVKYDCVFPTSSGQQSTIAKN